MRRDILPILSFLIFLATSWASTATDVRMPATPGKAVNSAGGVSTLLPTELLENGVPVRLEVVIFRPSGNGPFPLAVINHGSTGSGRDPALFTETWTDVGLANFLTGRGWMVAFPQRRGRGKSDGLYDEGFSENRDFGYACDIKPSLRGASRALQDVDAVIAALRRLPDIAPTKILIGGQSRGGILSIAYAGAHPDRVLGVIDFVGGWMGTRCPNAAVINRTLFEQGARFTGPTVWFYGHHDAFYPIEHSRRNFALFRDAGGQGVFQEFDVPGDRGHGVIRYPDLWRDPLTRFLAALATPSKP